ncbi:MAG: DUF3047 domain-containing protein [Alcanivoracaceae bacterium]
MTRIWLFWLLLLATPVVARWEPSPIPGWQSIRFAGETRYAEQPDCIRAEAVGSASGLIRAVDTGLAEAPLLRWGWRADELLQPARPAPEKTKAGDDFVARVYVIRQGRFFWQTRAINYVWSREHPVGSHWPNPFTSNAVMVVVQSGEEGLGEWREFERNVAADFRRFHDLDIDRVDAVAVMTDADNTGGRASACYRLPAFH